MDEQGQLVFTKDCVVNLDDLGDMEDYHELVKATTQMLNSNRCDDAVFKRLIEAQIDYLFQEEGITDVLVRLIKSSQSVNYKYRQNIAALLLDFSEDFLLSRQLQQSAPVDAFLEILEKHKSETTRMLLLHFLNRIAHKLIYVDQEAKKKIVLRFFEVLFRDDKQPTEKESYMLVEIVDILLRHKWVRHAMKHVYQKAGEPHAGSLVKFFATKYSHYIRN